MFNTLFSRAILALKTTASAVCERYGYKLVLQSEYISPEERTALLRKSEQYDDLYRESERQLEQFLEYEQEIFLAHKQLQEYACSRLNVNSSWQTLEKAWLDYHIEEIERESSRSWDSYHEYKRLLAQFVEYDCQGLSKEGMEYFKEKTGYSKNFILHTESGDETGNRLKQVSFAESSLH